MKKIQILVFLVFWTLFLSCESKKAEPYEVSNVVTNKSNFEISERDLGDTLPEQYMDGLIQTMDTLFEDSFDPYTGTNTLPEECQKENLPPLQKINSDHQVGRLMSLYASKNKLVGQCPREQEKLKVQYLILFCKDSKKMYVSKYFYESSKPWIKDPAIHCRPFK